jgi:hypothetical protein
MKTHHFLALLSAGILIATSLPAQTRLADSFDRYGYQVQAGDSAQCAYHYVDAGGGDLLALTAASENAPASDDGAVVVSLVAPFELYGVSTTSLVASSNGYLAAAPSLSEEDGGDFSADCPLPAIADNPQATQSRIDVYHADLDAEPNGGAMHAQYFPSCPRDSDTGMAEACTVVQWSDWALRGQAGVLGMQAILYHSSFEVVLQYQSLDASLGSTATLGVQGPDAVSGIAAGCAGSRALTPAMAVCLFDPRFPPFGDRIFENGFD